MYVFAVLSSFFFMAKLLNKLFYLTVVRLVAYIKAWQTVLNKRNKKVLFNFNTYTLAVMVIAVLQRQSKLPTIDNMPKWLQANGGEQPKDATPIKSLLLDFFAFFGNKYERKNHVISQFRNRFVYIHQTNESAQSWVLNAFQSMLCSVCIILISKFLLFEGFVNIHKYHRKIGKTVRCSYKI